MVIRLAQPWNLFSLVEPPRSLVEPVLERVHPLKDSSRVRVIWDCDSSRVRVHLKMLDSSPPNSSRTRVRVRTRVITTLQVTWKF